jgi:hypothetical protein
MFSGLTERNFDAYEPTKWRSHAFNRERLEVKEILAELGRQIGGGLTFEDGSPLLCELSTEHPALWNHKQVEAQHVFFSRNADARRELDRIIDRSRPLAALLEDPSPQRSHVFLSVSIFVDGVQCALKLHPDATVDRQNFEKKLEDPLQLARFLELARELPGEFRIGVDQGSSHGAAGLDSERLHALLEEFARPATSTTQPHWFWIGQSFARAQVLDAGPQFAERLRVSLARLLPFFQFLAWSRSNDYVSIRNQLREDTLHRRQKGLAKGSKVRIVSGMFAGRTGVIDKIDAKGMLRVLLGKMPVVVKAEDVERG